MLEVNQNNSHSFRGVSRPDRVVSVFELIRKKYQVQFDIFSIDIAIPLGPNSSYDP